MEARTKDGDPAGPGAARPFEHLHRGSWIYLCKAEIVPATCRLPVTQALGLTLPSHVANEGKIMEFAEECPNLDELGVRLHRGSWRRALSVRLVV